MGENTNQRSQGATEYLLILAAVLVITALAVYYVSRGAAYPTISANPAAPTDLDQDNIVIQVSSGSIPANEWEWRINSTKGADGTWVLGTEVLDASYVNLENGIDGADYATAAGTYYVSLRHKASLHVYFTDEAVSVL